MNVTMQLDADSLSKMLNDIAFIKSHIESQQSTNGADAELGKDVWLSTPQVIERFNIPERTLARYRQRRMLPFSQVGRKILYKGSDVDKFLGRHMLKAKHSHQAAKME